SGNPGCRIAIVFRGLWSRAGRPQTVKCASINRPHARRSNLDQMPVWVAEIEALSTCLPPALLFHNDSVLREPRFPPRQFVHCNGEREMKFTIAVVRRRRCA